MTKPAVPTPARGHVVEIDAMDVAEWESGQRTPQASDANLAELVRKSAVTPPAATPVPGGHAQTVPRERARTQMGPAIPRPPSRARTEPPGPPPKPARPPRAETTAGPTTPAGRARVPEIPAAPAASPPEPRRAPAPMTSKGIDFSLPVTATSPAAPIATSPAAPPVAGQRPVPPASLEFSMPEVETGPRSPIDPPRVRSQARPGSEPPRTATATSESGARPPQLEPPRSEPLPAPSGSLFAEPSRVGPGHNATPAGGIEPNTAWPPRPIPVDPRDATRGEVHGSAVSGQPPAGRAIGSAPIVEPLVQAAPPAQLAAPPPRLAAPETSIQPAPPPARDDDAGAERLQVGLSRRRLWWIGGGFAAVSLGAIVAALMIPSPEAAPPGAVDATATQAAEHTAGPGRDPRAAPPVDRAAADLRERVRLAREAAAAGVPMTVPVEPPAVERRAWPSAAAADAAELPRPTGRKPLTHRVIVDYSARPNEPPPPGLVAQSEEDPAIGMARTAYTTGNQRLFVGDLQGAIHAYRQALELYPGYVGGYRGLGLAYEELGDAANALAALRAYVAAVPSARDIVLIKKRIAHLQHH